MIKPGIAGCRTVAHASLRFSVGFWGALLRTTWTNSSHSCITLNVSGYDTCGLWLACLLTIVLMFLLKFYNAIPQHPGRILEAPVLYISKHTNKPSNCCIALRMLSESVSDRLYNLGFKVLGSATKQYPNPQICDSKGGGSGSIWSSCGEEKLHFRPCGLRVSGFQPTNSATLSSMEGRASCIARRIMSQRRTRYCGNWGFGLSGLSCFKIILAQGAGW